MVTFADNAKLKIKFSANSTKSTFETALDQLDAEKYRNLCWKNRVLLPELETAINAMFNRNNGIRTESKKAAILLTIADYKTITDSPDYAPDTEYEKLAKRFKQKDIRLKVVGVGQVFEKKLRLLVSHENDYVYARDFKKLLNEGEGFEVDDIC